MGAFFIIDGTRKKSANTDWTENVKSCISNKKTQPEREMVNESNVKFARHTWAILQVGELGNKDQVHCYKHRSVVFLGM